MRQEFLVSVDYGQGGLWAFMTAESEDQIRTRFPKLTVVADRPAWLDAEHESRLRETMSLDIDDDSHPFIKAVVGLSQASDS